LALELNFKFNDGLQIVGLYIQIARYMLGEVEAEEGMNYSEITLSLAA
jgi:hypothetical protein